MFVEAVAFYVSNTARRVPTCPCGANGQGARTKLRQSGRRDVPSRVRLPTVAAFKGIVLLLRQHDDTQRQHDGEEVAQQPHPS